MAICLRHRISVLQRNMVREGTAFLLDALAADKPEEGPLQTKLLEINLVTNPQVTSCWQSLLLSNITLLLLPLRGCQYSASTKQGPAGISLS